MVTGLGAYQARIDQRLTAILAEVPRTPASLCEAMEYSALAPGKRFRPALTMMACAACGASEDRALDAGCAIEIIHSFSLIHDDLPAIDNDDLRRGRPTSHVQFGEAMAILAGDALFALAFEVMSGSPAGLAGVLELARSVGVGGVVGGEMMDILSENAAPDATVLEQIHRQKTGALFACCGAVGAMCAGAAEPEIEALRSYGYHLGQAFQIADDILNETSSVEALGKAAGSDRDRGKMTYPALYGLEQSSAMAQAAVQHGKDSIAGLPGNREPLLALIEYALNRKS